MHNRQKLFLEKSRQKAFDLDYRRKINFSLAQSDIDFQKGKKQFADLATAREIAKNRKWEAIEHLDKYLLEFESKFTANGGKMILCFTFYSCSKPKILNRLMGIAMNKNDACCFAAEK